ncbi:MAG: DNA replication and repair protein RecF, partial [Spirochaetaceae bacterium]|nr:DNA replication and repair protein RecF [Spirochaetaceae bacterium]
MFYRAVRTASFRNLCDAEIETAAGDVFLVGENGQGKSNFLEALYFCSYGSSFRNAKEAEFIRTGEKSCSVSGTLGDALYGTITVKIEDGKKSLAMDGRKIADRKDILQASPAIVFCHEDMEFVAGSPERRRWFFDQSLSLYDPGYLDELRRFRRVLRNRNAALKQGEIASLDALDIQMAGHGMALMEKRRAAAALFSDCFGPLYAGVSGIEDVSVRYVPSWKEDGEDRISAALFQRRGGDLGFGTSMSGPHRDRYVFTRKGVEFAAKASTGQRRLLALLLRVAQARLYTGMTGRKPLLLLD